MKFSEIKNKVVLFFKSWFYTTLTEENIEKIIKRKEQELEDIEILEKQEMERIREDLYDELGDSLSDDEIEQIYKKVIGE